MTSAEPGRDWQALADRLLPLTPEPSVAPDNLDALTAWWGGPRELRPAAVLVGLVERADGLHVLLTRRHHGLSQHAGQISFPGGRVEPGDADTVQAALRETEEEIGVGCLQVRPLGRLEPLATVSEFLVQPVVAVVEPGYRLCLDPREVSVAFELPLARAACAELWRPYPVQRPGLDITLRCLDYQGHEIWGATAMILDRLLERMRGWPL